jgi:hypothetical protein
MPRGSGHRPQSSRRPRWRRRRVILQPSNLPNLVALGALVVAGMVALAIMVMR